MHGSWNGLENSGNHSGNHPYKESKEYSVEDEGIQSHRVYTAHHGLDKRICNERHSTFGFRYCDYDSNQFLYF